jgi:hypothetical protein
MGLKKLAAEPAEGQSTQVWADSARRIGPVSGLTLMLALACRHSAQRHPGRRVAAAHSDSYPTVRATQAAKCSPASRTLPLGGG